MSRPSQALLSRDKIVAAALDMTRRGRGFSVPGLAKELGVHPSSLYHHVPGGRGEIVDLMRARLYEDVPVAAFRDPSVPWRDRLTLWAHSYRAATAGAPWLIPLVMSLPVDDRPTQTIYDALFALLDEAGISLELRMPAATMLDIIVLGSALDESSPVPLWTDVPPELDHLATAAENHDTDDRKLAGLDLAVEAAIAWVEAHATARPSR